MAIENPLWMDPNPSTGVAPEYSARQDRGIIARLFTEGVEDVQAGHLLVAQRAAGANMTVEVAAGAAYVAGDDVARQGTYRVAVTSTESVTIPAAPASNSRIDLVALRVRDATAIGGSAHGATVEVITGTAAASPVAPAVPNTAIPLAQVLVAAGATSIQTSAITDRRTQAGANTLRVGTQPQPLTQAQRDALSGGELYVPRFIYNTDAARLELYTGSGWVGVGSCQIDIFTASGSWVKPAAAKLLDVVCIGGGSSGNSGGLGGSGGGYSRALLAAASVSSPVSITVGAGGAARTTTSGVNNGAASSFGTLVSAGGGNDSAGGSATGTAGPSGQFDSDPHRGGAPAQSTSSSNSGNSSGYGGGGGGGLNTNAGVAYAGGASGGLAGGAANQSGNGSPGASRSGSGLAGSGGGAGPFQGGITGGSGGIPGGGGGGAGGTGGSGGRGEVIIVTIF